MEFLDGLYESIPEGYIADKFTMSLLARIFDRIKIRMEEDLKSQIEGGKGK